MKHIRILSLSLALVLTLGLLASCGKSGSESGSASQSDAGISLPVADVSTPDTSTPDASQPEDETPAPEVKPEEKPEEKPMAPAVKPEVKPEAKPEAPSPAPGADETIPLPLPEETPEEKPEESPVPPEQTPDTVNLQAFYETIFTDPENSPSLIPMDAGALDGFYAGLTAIATKQVVAYMPMMTAVPCEIVMVECTNSADVEAVKDIFQARIDAQVSDHFNYPMVIAAWETEAKIVSNGNFVALFVVSGMTDQVAANFNALF